jgi:hypothetical protein
MDEGDAYGIHMRDLPVAAIVDPSFVEQPVPDPATHWQVTVTLTAEGPLGLVMRPAVESMNLGATLINFSEPGGAAAVAAGAHIADRLFAVNGAQVLTKPFPECIAALRDVRRPAQLQLLRRVQPQYSMVQPPRPQQQQWQQQQQQQQWQQQQQQQQQQQLQQQPQRAPYV